VPKRLPGSPHHQQLNKAVTKLQEPVHARPSSMPSTPSKPPTPTKPPQLLSSKGACTSMTLFVNVCALCAVSHMRLHAYPYTSAGADLQKNVPTSSLNDGRVSMPTPAHKSQFISPLFGPEEVSSQDVRANLSLSSEKLRNPYVSPMLQVCVRVHSYARSDIRTTTCITVLIARARGRSPTGDGHSCERAHGMCWT
jgi:hypothetical protein